MQNLIYEITGIGAMIIVYVILFLRSLKTSVIKKEPAN